MSKRVEAWVRKLQKYADRWWYAPLIGLIAFLDYFIIIIPTDGLLVSATMLAPKRWWLLALLMAIGSSLGAWTLAAILQVHGLPFLLELSPGVDQSALWRWSDRLMDGWGGWAVFLIGASPLMQHPVVALAVLAGMPLEALFAYMFGGRLLKFLVLAWISTHAPRLLRKLWGIQDELKETGVKLPIGEAEGKVKKKRRAVPVDR